MCKVITIQSLVWLRRTVRRWRSRAAARPGSKMERDDDAVPAGHVAVRVEGGAGAGEDARRFVVRVAHLNHPAFRELLRQAEEEYGFPSGSGPVALPCDEDQFRDVLRRVSSDERHHLVRATQSLALCRPAATCGVTKRRAESSPSSSSRAPLLQGMAMDSLVW
uniref:Auxin-responsive protein n=1 Tax=Oryza punctata TaxID=4537 RepID=A0A0E0KWC1_ORYPU